ncbi:MAG TPA: LysR family transcriptional regulator [Galbitalea sp.]|jgi:DNA-binding transcriptional LysR family regulator
MDRPDETTLRVLLAIETSGSLTVASASVGISQQAASARIRQFELRIGAALLIRSGRGSTLTPTGQLVAGWATEYLAASDGFVESLAALRSDVNADIAVAGSLTIAEHLLPRWLVQLRQQRGGRGQATAVTMTVGNSGHVADLVRTREAVLGFIESPEVPGDLDSRLVASDELILVVHPDHDWARSRRRVTAAEVAHEPLLTREQGSGTRLALEHALAGLSTPLAVSAASIELPSNAAIRASVAAGAGPAILSVLAVADDLALGRVVRVRISDLTITRPLRAIWIRGGSLPDAALELIEVARSR